MKKKPFFSIGMIFKNEIRCLERCLKSLQPLRDAVPCELVMADTGSTDGSREIAERYADVLFDFPWCDDFSAARNAVMDRCSGEWYFTIDADEWLTEDISELAAFSKEKKLPHDLGAVNIHNYNTVELDEAKQYNDFAGIRLLRMSTGIRYTGCIHEKWVLPNGDSPKAMMLYNTWLKHDGYAYANKAAEKAKHDRNMALLNKKLAEDPEDMQTLVECIDITKHDPESAEYARKVVEVMGKKPPHWEKFGPVVYRGAVSVGKLQKLPELREWIDQAVEAFPDSIYTRIDIAYYALAEYFDAEEYAEAVRWGARYLEALAEYRAGKYDHGELLRGALEYTSPFWERKVYILLTHAYLELGEYEEAFHALESIQGEGITENRQVESVTKMMMRLHRIALLDTPALVRGFWERINRPVPDEEMVKKRRAVFLHTAGAAFSREYRADERGRKEFLRHSYTMFAALEGECALGLAAAMLETADPGLLEEKLAGVEDWGELPIAALAHGIDCGAAFPLPDKPLRLEEMDSLINRMAQDREGFIPLALKALEGGRVQTLQGLCWARGLALTALRVNDWTAGTIPAGKAVTLSMGGPAEPAEDLVGRSMAVARAFARTERAYLPLCYAPDILRREALFMLPPLHRFGWYCAQAFQALDRGDQVGHVRLLREGLTSCESAKDVAEFLLEHVPDGKPQEPSAEMAALAEQIRAMLSQFAPDNPAVAVLKQSEAYQKVAYLIEGTPAPVMGGLTQ